MHGRCTQGGQRCVCVCVKDNGGESPALYTHLPNAKPAISTSASNHGNEQLSTTISHPQQTITMGCRSHPITICTVAHIECNNVNGKIYIRLARAKPRAPHSCSQMASES